MLRVLPLTFALASLGAWAHGNPPQVLDLHERAGHPGQLLAGTNFGGLKSDDDGQSWQLICEEAIGYGTLERPAWWLAESGTAFAASGEGLFVSRDGMCSWSAHPQFLDGGASDIEGSGGLLVVTTGSYVSSGILNNVYFSTDDGQTFTPSNAVEDAGFYSTARIAPSNPMRVYAAEWWFDPYTDKLHKSDDGARTFSSVDVTSQLPVAGAFYVLAVSPANPEVLLAEVTSGTSPQVSYLLLSENGGQTFASVAMASLPMIDVRFDSAAFSPDGQRAWAAATPDQLLFSGDGAHTFTPLAPPQKGQCVTAFSDRLYACGVQQVDGWELARGTTAASPNFGPRLIWQQIAGPLDCPSNPHVKDVCSVIWPVIQVGFAPAPPGYDAGHPSDGGAGGGTGGAGGGGKPAGSCGCEGAGPGLWLLWALLLHRRLAGGASHRFHSGPKMRG